MNGLHCLTYCFDFDFDVILLNNTSNEFIFSVLYVYHLLTHWLNGQNSNRFLLISFSVQLWIKNKRQNISTARKRSSGQSNFYTCPSVVLFAMGVSVYRDLSPGRYACWGSASRGSSSVRDWADPPPSNQQSGWYASHWNAFLFEFECSRYRCLLRS